MRKGIALPLVLASVVLVTSFGSAAERTSATGSEKSSKTRILEAGAKLLQERPPLKALNMYLNGFHFHASDMAHQMTAYHYCSNLSEELTQCAIYDADKKDARLIGIEYIVSERIFKSLPDEEKKLWHSHRYEVKSGTLVAPGIPVKVEHELMEKIVSTYGKTWHTWDSMHEELPVGIPALMMGFTGDGQMDQRILQERDRLLDINSAQRRKDRATIATPAAVPGADAWEKGSTPILEVTEGKTKGMRK